MKEQAVELVRKLLARRLARAGISSSNPAALIQCEADKPQPYPGGWQVPVHTWRQWSEARIKLDADSGEFIGYAVDRYADPVTRTELTREQAEALARGVVALPEDAELDHFQHVEWAPSRRLVELEWRHMHRGLRVDGDRILVVLHPDTHRIVEFERYWRVVRLP
jgi:hypothetical protein